MGFKLRELNPIEKAVAKNVGLNASLDDIKNKDVLKMVEYFPSSKGWMALGKTTVLGNTVTYIESTPECKLIEEVKPELEVVIENKIPASILKEIIGSFNRIFLKNGNEAAAQIYQERDTGKLWVYYPKQTISKALVTYTDDPNLVTLLEKNSLIMELHSHNSMGAFWSGTDDANENVLGYYMVIGRFGSPKCEYKLRCKYKKLAVDLKIEDLFALNVGETEDDILLKEKLSDGNPKIEEVATVSAGYTYTGAGTWKSYNEYQYKDYSKYRGKYNNIKYASSGVGTSSHNNSSIYSTKLNKLETYLYMNPEVKEINDYSSIYDDIDYLAYYDCSCRAKRWKDWVKEPVISATGNSYAWKYVKKDRSNVDYIEDSPDVYGEEFMRNAYGYTELTDDWDVYLSESKEITNAIKSVNTILDDSGIDGIDAAEFCDLLEEYELDALAELYNLKREEVIEAFASADKLNTVAITSIMEIILCADSDDVSLDAPETIEDLIGGK